MNWEEYGLARLLMAETRIGAPMREQDLAALDEDQRGRDLLKARGLVD